MGDAAHQGDSTIAGLFDSELEGDELLGLGSNPLPLPGARYGGIVVQGGDY